MRYRLMATYRGVPYEAGIGPTESEVVLFAACPPPEELGFEPATGHWRKQLGIEDVQALWESRPMGTFRGARCIVLDDMGDRLHIAYLGHDAYQAEQLGYWQVDRGVFELVTPRDEVKEIVEERVDYPQRSAGARPECRRNGRRRGWSDWYRRCRDWRRECRDGCRRHRDRRLRYRNGRRGCRARCHGRRQECTGRRGRHDGRGQRGGRPDGGPSGPGTHTFGHRGQRGSRGAFLPRDRRGRGEPVLQQGRHRG